MRAVNLIPSEHRTGAPVGVGRSQGGAYAVLALILGLAGMTALYGKADHQLASGQAQAASLSTQAQQAESQASRLAPYTSFVALRQQREQAVETLLESRFDWAHVFHEFGRVLPAGTSISSLDGTVGSASAAGAKPTSSATVASSTPPGATPSFSLAGCAVSQPAVAELLGRLRLIDGVSEVQLQSSSASSFGSAGASTGGCPAHAPAFTVVITFDPLPSATAVAAATTPAAKSVSDSTSSGAVTKPQAGKTGVSAR